MNGMKIDFVTNTVIITKAFREAANEYGSEEYIALTKLLQEHPSMKVVLRQSRTCHRANENKGLTYKYMRKFIAAMDEENLGNFEKTILHYEQYYEESATVYVMVKNWFLENYPNHRELIFAARPQIAA